MTTARDPATHVTKTDYPNMGKTQMAISGIIGTGKTTCVRALAKMGFSVFEEPAETNPYLSDFYNNKDMWGFPMQMFMLNQRVDTTRSIIKTGYGIQDRSVYEDGLFVETNFKIGAFDKRNYDLYHELFRKLTADFDFPQVFVYLKTDPKICLQRVTKRGREAEKEREGGGGVDISYLTHLHEEYEIFFRDISQKRPVIAVDSTLLDVDAEPQCYESLCKFIENTIARGLKPGVVDYVKCE